MATYLWSSVVGPLLAWLVGGVIAVISYLAYLEFKHLRRCCRMEARRARLGLLRHRRSLQMRCLSQFFKAFDAAAPDVPEHRLPPRCTGARPPLVSRVRLGSNRAPLEPAAAWRWPLTIRMKVSTGWTATVAVVDTRTGNLLAGVPQVAGNVPRKITRLTKID